ncbi:helix-turn-helix domain-containing protein [Pseudarthrobacter sp. lyk4-40-TYG-27]|uniref:sigma-54-dependent Fis family transcriptional regulator n=1 Tax=Pseudarthrobacter sp. lyk4-40-TYG-27 TaxID=3040305 RepID=UPI0025572ECF|nr:helix-turn-helix domain-containing protein [Pseudarthrobacter sp. lyk4-40-TYG-27]
MASLERPVDKQLSSLRAAREQFLISGMLTPDVRSPIRDSWSRSAHLGVDPVDLSTASGGEVLQENEIFQGITTVLQHTAGILADEPVSIIFAAPSGDIVDRYCSDFQLRKKLESVFLTPGYAYGESDVGTNGIGTTIEGSKPTLVVGDEHFNEKLFSFACAGAPVHHPASGALLGVVDITCNASIANPLLLATAKSIAAQIQDALTEHVGARELALLRDYMAACRRSSGPVLALNSEVVMMNRHAQALLAPDDRAALLAHTADSVNEVSSRTVVADLPSGTTARMHYRPTTYGDSIVGGVFRVQVGKHDSSVSRAPASRLPMGRLPGLIGTSPDWLRACSQVQEDRAQGRSVVIEGETGVGKLAVLKAAHYANGNGEHLRVIDCGAVIDPEEWLDEVSKELKEASGTLMLQHLEQLPDTTVGPLSELLVRHSEDSQVDGVRWLVATRTPTAEATAVEAMIVPCFDSTVRIPPLRHRSQDIGALATLFLRTSARCEDISFTQAALRQLARLPWNRNLVQLRAVVNKIVRSKRSGVIDVGDLPPECQSVVRRSLTHLESLERDAIVEALRTHGDNKNVAAEHLGMSRATIYRKIRGYGISVTPTNEAPQP